MTPTELFDAGWAIHNKGGWTARASRWRSAPAIIAQRLGLQRWMSVPLFFGQNMIVLTGETFSRGLIAFGYAEVALTALILRSLRPGMTFVDVGTHLGYEAMLASKLVGNTGRVISFEPQPEIFKRAKRNLAHFRQARIVNCAVGSRSGTLNIQETDLAQSAFAGTAKPNEKSIAVPMVMLDEAVTECPVHFIKCDVEGAEMEVLKGATDILPRIDRYWCLKQKCQTLIQHERGSESSKSS